METALSFIEAGLTALAHAVHDRDDALRNLQLATVSPGGGPGLRTLVLRGFTRTPACAEMHTDARAGKARDIARCGEVALLAWSAALRLQLRFEGTARLHRADELARGRWDKLSPKARDAYGLRAEPGTPVADPGPQSHLAPEEQFQQFAVILVALARVDVLRLEPDGGQTRASGGFTPTGITADWVGP